MNHVGGDQARPSDPAARGAGGLAAQRSADSGCADRVHPFRERRCNGTAQDVAASGRGQSGRSEIADKRLGKLLSTLRDDRVATLEEPRPLHTHRQPPG